MTTKIQRMAIRAFQSIDGAGLARVDFFLPRNGGDLVINVTKTKKLTNMRASGADEKMRIAPAIKFSLEEALEYIQSDEYVEVTPKSIRLRKIYLNENERKRFGKANA